MLKKGVIKLWKWGKRIFLFIFIFHLIYIVLLKWMNPPITITQLSSFIKGDGLKRDYISSKNISYNAKLAVIAAEDQLFPDHNGFDWKKLVFSSNHCQLCTVRNVFPADIISF